MYFVINLIGVLVFLAVGVLLSKKRKDIHWRGVGSLLALNVFIAWFLTSFPIGRDIVQGAAAGFTWLVSVAYEGIAFAFPDWVHVPQMNFFDAQLVRSGNGFTVKTEDMNVALAPETCAQLALNWDGGDVKEITAGVRPEQILLADKGEEGALQGTVEVTELMGSTEHVHVTAPDGQFVLIIPVVDLEAKGALKAGDPIWFKFEKNATHLFDKVSGKNLI